MIKEKKSKLHIVCVISVVCFFVSVVVLQITDFLFEIFMGLTILSAGTAAITGFVWFATSVFPPNLGTNTNPFEARKTNKRAEMLLIRINVLRGSTLEEACQKAHDKMKEYGFEPCIPYQMLYIKHDDMPYRQYSRYSAEEEKLLGDKERGEVRENSSQNLDSKYVAITKEWVEREEEVMYPQAYHNFVEKYRQQRNNVPYFDYKKEVSEDEWKLYNIVYNTFRENQGWWEYNTLEAYENEDYIVYSEIPKNEGEYNSMMSRSTRAGSYIKPKTLVWDEKYGMCEILGYHGIFYAVKTDDGRIVEDGIVTGNEKQMKRIR